MLCLPYSGDFAVIVSCLSYGFVSRAGVVCGAVREQPVDDHADDGEEEDYQTPQDLVAHGTVGLQNLDWEGSCEYIDRPVSKTQVE